MFHVEQNNDFDILILGGGHAGIEAAHIAKQLVDRVGIVTLPEVGLASAPCNPSIGGVGKGQVVRELDFLGGIMPRLADFSGIQFRTLNESKGYAVQSTRVQIDKELYSKFAEEEINKAKITVVRQKILSVKKENDLFILNSKDQELRCKKLIVTVGTFLNGKLHTGQEIEEGGRVDAKASSSLGDIFSTVKIGKARFKTGTPARLHKDSINYSVLEEQPSDDSVDHFHFAHQDKKRFQDQVSCYLAYTNSKTLGIIRDNKEKSPMYNGQIKAVGARYCPSIEDKAYRYPDKDIHHVFVEPEGLNLDTVYPSGISSSLPRDVQEDFVHSIKGLEESKILVHGYAVEYDVVNTTELDLTLNYKEIPGLYFAGQVNGTSGYEEAAAQGYIAGVNAARTLLGKSKIVMSRNDSYIGVLIEDLVSNTRDEPYRLFTARAENRLYIREDNTFLRIKKYREQLELATLTDNVLARFQSQFELLNSIISDNYINPDDKFLIENSITIGKRRISIFELLTQSKLDPVLTLTQYLSHVGLYFNPIVVRAMAIETKYSGYINKANNVFERSLKLDSKKLDWNRLVASHNISFECKERIKKIQPETFGQLKRIEGIRQATLAIVAAEL